MKDPAFLFYPGDWLSGTMYFSFEEKGAYMELLMLQFNNGCFSEEQAKKVLRGSENIWEKIREKFTEKNGLFFNKRLRIEIEKRLEYSKKQSERVKKRWYKSGIASGNTVVLPKIENENENIIEDLIESKKGGVGEKVEIKTADEVEFENFRKAYPGTKGGFKKEFDNFKKHKDWHFAIYELLPALGREVQWREEKRTANEFCPEFKHLKTWLNNRCWEQELSIVSSGPKTKMEQNIDEFTKVQMHIQSLPD